MKRAALTTVALLCLSAIVNAAPRLDTLDIPGRPAFVKIARDVMSIDFAIDPSQASAAGLIDDSLLVPVYTPASVEKLKTRLDLDMKAMRAMDWRSWTVDEQIDFRWVYANAELYRRQLVDERLYQHRAACWLEPTANNLIGIVTYAPQRTDAQAAVLEKVPAMLAEIRKVCSAPTERDVITAQGIVKGLLVLCRNHPKGLPERLVRARRIADSALSVYLQELEAPRHLPLYRVIGAENYAWRYSHALLFQLKPQDLLASARLELQRVQSRMKELSPPVQHPATPEQIEMAQTLTRDKLLALYDSVEIDHRNFLLKSDMITIDASVGPIKARETPEAMVPLTGDGGSMNPPPPFIDSDVGWWNVEHFQADWPLKKRLAQVVRATEFRSNSLGPYSAHEGVPGHHLQLSIARHLKDPIRNVLTDSCQNEGWALYAEEMFWRGGGLGPGADAEYCTLDSYRYRCMRVIYDVQVETRRWTLQQGADFRMDVKPGQGRLDEELLRSIQWPTQLVGYFAGKQQIIKLREDCRQKWGSSYSDRRFHDELLAVGSIPFVFARAKLLGEPVPALDLSGN